MYYSLKRINIVKWFYRVAVQLFYFWSNIIPSLLKKILVPQRLIGMEIVNRLPCILT